MEWESGDGCIVCLGNKLYQCFCNDKQEKKRSTKGLPHCTDLEMDLFKDVLFGSNSAHRMEINSLRLNQNKQMTRMTTTKNGLSDIFLKMRVSEDKISCSPLTLNGELL